MLRSSERSPSQPASTPLHVAALPRAADFLPPTWLRNAHAQSILASSAPRRFALRRARNDIGRRSREHVLDCGAGVRLQGFHTPQQARAAARGLVVVLHGWEGSAASNYVIDTAARLLDDGFDVFRLNFRDHGDTHHLNRDLFHSCRIEEVVGAVAALAKSLSPRALAVTGFSLGGNFALRVAKHAHAADIPLDYALAVCPVISPAAGLFGLEHGLPIYERYFLHKWRRSLRRKQTLFPDADWFTRQELAGNLRALTESLVLRHTDFGSLDRYLDGYSIAGDALASLDVPATILTSADDPVIPIADFRALVLPANVELDIAQYGGHCGFIRDAALRSFSADYIAARMLHHADADSAGIRIQRSKRAAGGSALRRCGII